MGALRKTNPEPRHEKMNELKICEHGLPLEHCERCPVAIVSPKVIQDLLYIEITQLKQRLADAEAVVDFLNDASSWDYADKGYGIASMLDHLRKESLNYRTKYPKENE